MMRVWWGPVAKGLLVMHAWWGAVAKGHGADARDARLVGSHGG